MRFTTDRLPDSTASQTSVLLLLSLSFTFASTVRAQECAGDADCPDGYACVEFAQGCPACDPASGGECPPCDPVGTATYCEIVVADCAADADCAEGLICVQFTGEACSGGTVCPDNDPDCVSEPGACETVDDAQCAPPWIASCVEDADCGPGFLCVEQEVCTCTVYPDPGTGEPPPPEECTCDSTGDRACELQIVACAADADCPDGLVCAEGPSCAAPCTVSEEGVTECPCGDGGAVCGPPGFVNSLPVDQSGSGGVEAAPISSEGEGEGEGEGEEGEGEGEDDDGGAPGCSAGGAASGLAPLFALALSLTRRRRS